MNEKELMKFVIERSNDPIIKNPVLRDAMNKDLGPRNNYFAGTLVKAGKKLLSKTPTPKPKPIKPSILKRETIPLNLTQVNEISKNKEFEQAWKNYKISIRKVGRRKFNKDQFFEIWARENMAQGGRTGYASKGFVTGSGPGTGLAVEADVNVKKVKSALNKIKKQINNKSYFEWNEKSDWYKKLQKDLGGRVEGLGMNSEYTNKLINKVVNENFPGSYHGKSAIKNLRQDMVVNGFVEYLKDNKEFDGGEKFLKSLEKFEGVGDHKYQNINTAWKDWIAGDFEVEGVDRTQLQKELNARGIDYSKIDNWSASASQKRGLKKKSAIEFLDNQNNKFPNRSFEEVQKLYKVKYPDRNIYIDVNTLTDIKRTGIYKSGDKTTSTYKNINKGNRSNWLKESYGKQFQGNYSKLIKAADQLEAAGEFKKAKRISDAADKFFGPNGLITNAKGEGEHALARTFDLLNPNRQLAINSLVSGDLNQFKKNFFDVPVKRYFDEYNSPETTTARRKELKTLIEDRKSTLNSLTGGQKKGIVAGDIVKFEYGVDKITPSSSVEAIDTLFKEGKFNIDDYIARGTAYGDAFKIAGKEADIFTKTGDVKSTYSKPINDKKAVQIFKKMGFRCKKAGGGVEDVACYLEDVKKTKADARSSDVLKRAKALTKERKALQVAKTLPKVGNIIRKGVQVGAGAVSGALSAIGLGPVGTAIEAAIEGGFYDNARRNGYTHQQAYAETFLPKLITDAAGTTNTGTSLFEGADAMIEKEKLGKEDSLASKFNNAQNIFNQETQKLDNMVNSYMQMQNSGVGKEDLDVFLEKIYLQEDKVTNLMNTIKPGTPAYEAYKTAEENQTGRMENRKNDYLSMNRIPYMDAQGNMQEKTFPLSPAQIKQQEQKLQSRIKSGDKRRDKEMEEYKKGYKDSVLEPVFLKENEKANWSSVYGDGPNQEALKWNDIFEGDGAYDLTDKIGIAGGVSKMASGGLANLMKKYYD